MYEKFGNFYFKKSIFIAKINPGKCPASLSQLFSPRCVPFTSEVRTCTVVRRVVVVWVIIICIKYFFLILVVVEMIDYYKSRFISISHKGVFVCFASQLFLELTVGCVFDTCFRNFLMIRVAF